MKEEKIEKSIEKNIEKPEGRTVEEPVEKTIEKPVEETIEKPVEETIEEPVEKTIEKPVEETIENTVERRIEEFREISAQKPAGSIRMATPEDASAIAAIYDPYIRNTAITFEYDPVAAEVMCKRINEVMKQFPWLVYEREGRVLGYAYCSRFKERAAFDWDCECSVYIDEKEHRKGIASELYNRLFELIRMQGYYNIYALITFSHQSSIELHKKFGFTEVGVYQKTGYKFEKWWDLLVMEKRLRSFEKAPVKPRSIHELIV